LESTISAVNPLEHAEQIKQLFVAHERPEFAAFFNRAYAAGVPAGGGSWVGRCGFSKIGTLAIARFVQAKCSGEGIRPPRAA
jgi:hypothetical protein